MQTQACCLESMSQVQASLCSDPANLQGVLTNSDADIDFLINEDLRALSGLLGDNPYFLGPNPTLADASAFGTLENYLYDGNEASPIPAMVRKYPNLVRFVDSIRTDFYADKLSKQGKAQ